MPETAFLQLIYGLLAGLAAGVMGGALAGIAGLGGGLIYVPLFFTLMPGAPAALPVFASLLAVAVTGLFSLHAHWRLGHVRLAIARQLLPGLVIGSSLGLWTTLRVPEALVLLALALLDAWVAYDFGRKPRILLGQPSLMLASGPIGYFSGMLGIGGGTLLVPLLRRHLPLREAVGTTALCGVVMAAAAVACNILIEPAWHALLSTHLAFLAGAWLGILLAMPKAARWAAGLHGRWPEASMRPVLKALFACLSLLLLLAALVQLWT